MVTQELYANLSMNKRAGMRRDDDDHIYALFRTGSEETFTGMECRSCDEDHRGFRVGYQAEAGRERRQNVSIPPYPASSGSSPVRFESAIMKPEIGIVNMTRIVSSGVI